MRALQVVSVMARLSTTLLVLALAWSCRSEWDIHVVKKTRTTLRDLKYEPRGFNLTDEDRDTVLVQTKCLTPCPVNLKARTLENCYRPLKKQSSCAGDSCNYWYSYTTHCGCVEDEDNIDFIKANDPEHKCAEELEKNSEEHQNECQPDVITIHMDENNERVSSLTLRVCPVKCGREGLWVRKVNGTPREAKVAGGVTVAWEDEICGSTDVHGDTSDGDEALKNKFNVTVTSCDSKSDNISLKNLHKKLEEVLKDCPSTSTSTTIPPPIPPTATKFSEIETLAKFEGIMEKAMQSEQENNNLPSNDVRVMSVMMAVVVAVVVVVVLLLVIAIAKRCSAK